MGRARTWKLVGTGAAVAALGAAGLTALGGAVSSASTAHDHHRPTPQGRGPADQGPPGWLGGTTLTVGGTAGATTTNSGGTSNGGSTTNSGGTTTTTGGTTIEVSSYDFVKGLATAANAPTTGIAPNNLVVTTSLAAQSDLAALSQGGSGELVVRGDRGPGGLDATFTGLALQQYEVSSANGGTMTFTFSFTGVNLGSSTSPGTSSGSSSNSGSNSGS